MSSEAKRTITPVIFTSAGPEYEDAAVVATLCPRCGRRRANSLPAQPGDCGIDAAFMAAVALAPVSPSPEFAAAERALLALIDGCNKALADPPVTGAVTCLCGAGRIHAHGCQEPPGPGDPRGLPATRCACGWAIIPAGASALAVPFDAGTGHRHLHRRAPRECSRFHREMIRINEGPWRPGPGGVFFTVEPGEHCPPGWGARQAESPEAKP